MKLFAILWLTGMTGVISILGMNLPIPEDEELQLPLWSIKLLSLIQPTILLSIAVLIGVTLAHKVGLSAPLAEAVAYGTSIARAIQPQVIPGIIGGLVGSIALITIEFFTKPLLPLDFVLKGEAFSNNTSFLTRILYGGITEELLLRWGVMTLFVWIGWYIFAKGQGEPSVYCFVAAIALSAFLFGLGHLPLVFALGTPVTTLVVAYVIIGNSVFGLIAGYLYWYLGLEAAMIAHMLFHIVRVTVNYFAR
ncbi:CPBP family intramembrane glutamic endopeptidase [Chroococcidiopsis sp. TS-821]|uniref:CPBP family intramembrane glutamic endopeptidase n=1 Tax=Chroococcidiopsis sp. TS-821 TaxID=1378066 RepID=UPI000CEEA138|nr:CPBP family intramembrane glutamic endopeptidase [Chroococcidiopsis sp. TS-821]PPS43267.1 CAAX protease family protein [Chroococcidiopsis sp. TS-821]